MIDASSAIGTMRAMFDPKKTTKANVLAMLKNQTWPDGRPYPPDIAHYNADMLLLALINDPDITTAFDAIEKWYE
jgi:hypothetical protein